MNESPQAELNRLLEEATKERDSRKISILVQRILELLDTMENNWRDVRS